MLGSEALSEAGVSSSESKGQAMSRPPWQNNWSCIQSRLRLWLIPGEIYVEPWSCTWSRCESKGALKESLTETTW